MAQLSERLKTKALGFYVVVVVVAILAWAGQSYMNHRAEVDLAAQGGIAGQVAERMDGLQAKTLDAFLDVNQQVTTLGTALLGGVFYLLFNSGKGFAWKQRKWAAVMGVLFVAISIFFGYVAYIFVIAALGNGNPDATASKSYWAEQAHFYTFLLGVVFFADFVFHNLPNEVEP